MQQRWPNRLWIVRHGESAGNVAAVAAMPEVVEPNIGHFLIGQAITDGLANVVGTMRALMQAARDEAA